MSSVPSSGAPGHAVIEVTTSYSAWTFLLAFCRPRVAVNGQVTVVAWGTTSTPVVPGRYPVEVWVHYLFYRHMGRSGLVIDAMPGTVTRVRWKGPWTAFTKGRMTLVEVVPLGAAAGPAAVAWPPTAAPVAAPAAPTAPAAADAGASGWHPDPSGRHEQRYFDGSQWTEHISNAGVAGTDRPES